MSIKFLLTVYICSAIGGDCYTNPDYPKVFDDHHDCIRAGLSDSYEIIYAEGNFTKDEIRSLVVAVNGNSQIHDRREARSTNREIKQCVAELYENNFDYSRYPNFN